MMVHIDIRALNSFMAEHPEGPLSPSNLAERIRALSPNHTISERTIQRVCQRGKATWPTARQVADGLDVRIGDLIAAENHFLDEVLLKAEQDVIAALSEHSVFNLEGTLLATSIFCGRLACGVAINLKGDKGDKTDLAYATEFVDMVQEVAKDFCEDLFSEAARRVSERSKTDSTC